MAEVAPELFRSCRLRTRANMLLLDCRLISRVVGAISFNLGEQPIPALGTLCDPSRQSLGMIAAAPQTIYSKNAPCAPCECSHVSAGHLFTPSFSALRTARFLEYNVGG